MLGVQRSPRPAAGSEPVAAEQDNRSVSFLEHKMLKFTYHTVELAVSFVRIPGSYVTKFAVHKALKKNVMHVDF